MIEYWAVSVTMPSRVTRSLRIRPSNTAPSRSMARRDSWLNQLVRKPTRRQANAPKAYEKNTTVLEGVESGEVDLGLINHYYWYERVAEKGKDNVVSAIRFLNSDDPGSLINVAGVGVISGTDQREAADKAVNFLVGQRAQTYFADETAEYPVVAGVTTTKHELPALTTLKRPTIDLNDLDSLPATLEMLNQVGLT